MLREETIYMAKLHWEPKIPSIEEIKRQVTNKNLSCDNSVRVKLGKLTNGTKEM